MLHIFFFLLLFAASPALCKDVPVWITTKIAQPYTPVSKETDAILLYSDTLITYRDGEITTQEKRLYRIVKLEGLSYGNLSLDIVKGTKVSDIKGYRFDGSGKLLEELKKENILRTAFNEHFFDDCQQLTASFQSIETGNIVAFEYEMEEEPFFKESFEPFGNSIEIAYKRIEVPPGALCVILNDPGKTIRASGTEYIVQSQPAYKIEDNGPALRERVPFVGIIFEPDPTGTWESFSRKFHQKTSEIPRLSDRTKQSLHELLAVRDRSEFILKTLDHVSNSVRYVAIEVGEGGFIPRPVDLVHDKKYGDCKDMAFYAVAILTAGGVRAFPVLARMNDIGPVFEPFPSNQFNHSIIAVELDAGSIALQNIEINGKPFMLADPTDKYTVPPMIGYHLENTKALPVTDNGSALVTVPGSPAEKSLRNYEIHTVFSADRSARFTMTETTSGHPAARDKSLRDSLEKLKESEFYRNRVQRFVPGSEMTSFSIDDGIADDGTADDVAADDVTARTRIDFTARNLGTDVDDLIYYVPNIINATNKGYTQRTRESDFLLLFNSSQKIDITVDIDPSFQILEVPTGNTMDNEFFSGSMTAQNNGNAVKMQLQFAWKVNRISTGQYPAFRKLYQEYLKLAKSPITLKPAR